MATASRIDRAWPVQPDPNENTVLCCASQTVADIEKAITKAELGLNPSSDGKVLRAKVPKASAEVRDRSIKQLSEAAEMVSTVSVPSEDASPARRGFNALLSVICLLWAPADEEEYPPSSAPSSGRCQGHEVCPCRRYLPAGGTDPGGHKGRLRPRHRDPCSQKGSDCWLNDITEAPNHAVAVDSSPISVPMYVDCSLLFKGACHHLMQLPDACPLQRDACETAALGAAWAGSGCPQT